MDLLDMLDCSVLIEHKPYEIKGEDAFAFSCIRNNLHAHAVFDGCGGSGAWKYSEFKNTTGAFVAAQSMANLFAKWYSQLPVGLVDDVDAISKSFHDMAADELARLKASCAPMGITGSLVKSFPCTASAALITKHDSGTIQLTSLQAGDSRIYYLTPQHGLVQFTQDESRGNPDALESLRDSVPLSNLLNADKPFFITAQKTLLSLPCAVISATDGMFGFLRSPMDFEYLLLNTLCQAKSMAEFEATFQREIARITGDDSTCVMFFYGWNSFEAVKTSMFERLKYVSQIVEYMNDAGDDIAEEERRVVEQWLVYKKTTVFSEIQE